MFKGPVKCLTPDCPTMSYHTYCLSCSAEAASRRALEALNGGCMHSISVTGDYGMVIRLLPAYMGGQPQPGYMLDVCKACLCELPERPYNPSRRGRGH